MVSSRNRWTVLIACIWIECCAGASYSFGIYSETMKRRFGYTQQELETISVFKDVGECVGIISGLMYDKFPPWVVLLVGALQNLMGYIMIWFILGAEAQGISDTPAVWEMGIHICIAVNGQTYFNTVSIVTCIHNFPANRGIVVGLMKGCSGLSSAILNRIWHVMPPSQRSGGSSFLLIAAVIPTAMAVLLMPVVRKCDEENDSEKSMTLMNLALASAPVVLLALFLMGSAFYERQNLDANRVECIVAILIAISPLWVMWKTDRGRVCSCAPNSYRHDTIMEALIIENETADSDSSRQPTRRTLSIVHGNYNSLTDVLHSIDFFLLLFCSGVALGSGFVAINNMNQVATSLGYRHVSIFITLVSIFQFLGRFGGGACSDYLMHFRLAMPRPLLIAVAGFILSFGYALIASSWPGSLHLGCVVTGLAFGAHWSLVPATASDLFGLRHFGTLYNLVLVANPLISYILSVWVAGYFYDREAGKQGRDSQCTGNQCFNVTFYILAAVCMSAAFAALALWIRTKRLYRELVLYNNIRNIPAEVEKGDKETRICNYIDEEGI